MQIPRIHVTAEDSEPMFHGSLTEFLRENRGDYALHSLVIAGLRSHPSGFWMGGGAAPAFFVSII